MNNEIAREMQTLVDAHAELGMRHRIVDRTGAAYFEPTDDHPLMDVRVDATTGVFDYPKAVYLAEDISRHGRKLAMKLQVIVTDTNHVRFEVGCSSLIHTGAEMVKANA